MRTLIGVLIAAALLLGVFFFWPDGSDDTTPSTEAAATSTTSTTLAPTTTVTTTPPPSSTSSSSVTETHVVQSVAEAEEILRELWFGWFEGIYNEDEDRIRQVVATQGFLEAGISAFDALTFDTPPTIEGLHFNEIEILESTADCLVVWSVTTPDYLVIDTPRSGVEVLRSVDGNWRFMSSWQLRDDLWEDDCEAQLQPLE